VFGVLDSERVEREESLDASAHVEFYRAEARFTGPRLVELGEPGGGELITAPRIVIATGARVAVPPIPGLEAVPYLVSDAVFQLRALPGRLAIIGGGPIALEMANFFGGLGVDVTLLAIEDVLAEREDREIAQWFTREYERRFRVELSTTASDFEQTVEGIAMTLRPSGDRLVVDQLLVAAGRRPNSDTLNLEAAGVEVAERGGGIVVNKDFETSAEGVWAFGDVTDLLPLKHVSVRQARNLIRRLFHDEHPTLDYDLVPHSTFSHPQIAAVGRSEEQLQADGVGYRAGRYEFQHTARGMALQENGIVKILVDEDGRILGGHIVGPHASILIQEIVIAMQAGGAIELIIEAVHAHPALPQVVEEAAKAAQRALLDG